MEHRNKKSIYLIITMVLFIVFICNCKKDDSEVSHNKESETVNTGSLEDNENNNDGNEGCIGMKTFTDTRDNNVYHTVQIGEQCWMAENLRYLPDVSHPELISHGTPRYYVYDNYHYDINYALSLNSYKIYGVLYNWPSAKIACPEGWHLPSDEEWEQLENYLIENGYNYDGTTEENKIAKSLSSKSLWYNSDKPGVVGNDLSINNASGFTGLPAGFLNDSRIFLYDGISTYWWSSTEYYEENYAIYVLQRSLYTDMSKFIRSICYSKSAGLSVRCIKDS